jgi:hypothetical protein
MLHRALEAVEVVLETEEAATPDVGHVIGRVRAQETPVEDRDARLRDGYKLPIDEGRAVRVRSVILRRPLVLLYLLHVHLYLTLSKLCAILRQPLLVVQRRRARTLESRADLSLSHPRVNAFICGV